jgi:hypothetical protein
VRAASTWALGAGDQNPGGAGAGDDHVGLGEDGGQLAERRRPAGVLARQPLGALAGAVDDDDLCGASPRGGGGGQPGHGTGADHDDPATCDVAAVPGGPV